MVGLLYPCIDSHLGEPHKFKREWASVMRCIAVFVGINHASAVSFSQSLLLGLTLCPSNCLCHLGLGENSQSEGGACGREVLWDLLYTAVAAVTCITQLVIKVFIKKYMLKCYGRGEGLTSWYVLYNCKHDSVSCVILIYILSTSKS